MRGRRARVLVAGAGLAGASVAWAATRVCYEVTVVSPDRVARGGDTHGVALVFGLGPPGALIDWPGVTDRMLASHARLRETGRSALEEALLASQRDCGFRYVEHRIDWSVDRSPPLGHAAATALTDRLVAAGYGVRRIGRAIVGDDAVVGSRRLALELLRQARARRADLRLGSEVLGCRHAPSGRIAADIDGEEEAFDRVFWAGVRPAGETAATSRVILHQRSDAGECRLESVVESADSRIVLYPPTGERSSASLKRVGRASGDGRFVWRELPDAWRPWVGAPEHQLLSESFMLPAHAIPEPDSGVTCLSGLASWPVASMLGAAVELVGAGPADGVSGPAELPS